MAFNVDVIDNDTGEIYREGVLLANAHIFISREKGKIIRDEVDIIDLDGWWPDGSPEYLCRISGREVEERVVG